ncbi:MAG: hypothetical protein ACTSW1_13295 [Candidatus Hodarchaeales archaeon]
MSLDSIEIRAEILFYQGRNNNQHEVFVVGLSTCQWCKQGLRWLRNNNITHSYIFIDRLDLDERKLLKKRLEETFNIKIIFPLLIIDRFQAYPGFNTQDWEVLLR